MKLFEITQENNLYHHTKDPAAFLNTLTTNIIPDSWYARYQEWHPTGHYAVSSKEHWPFPARGKQDFVQMQLTISPEASVWNITDRKLFDEFWKFYISNYPNASQSYDDFIVDLPITEIQTINKAWTNLVKSKYDIVHITDGDDEHIILNNNIIQDVQQA